MLSVPRTKYVKPFTELVGREVYKEENKVSGYYYLKVPFNGCSKVTGLVGVESYVGQATHIGHRIKHHAKGADPNTKSFISSWKK